MNGIENKIKYLTELDHIISLKYILDATSKLINNKAIMLRFRFLEFMMFMVLNVIFNNITVISWRSVLFVGEM